MKDLKQKELLVKAVKYTVDNLSRLKNIVIYSACSNDDETYESFNYAISKGIKLIIPDIVLRSRNILKEASKNG